MLQENIERDRDNEKSMNELNDLRRSFGTKEQQLREAVEKVDREVVIDLLHP
jgi:hypothetical protein